LFEFMCHQESAIVIEDKLQELLQN